MRNALSHFGRLAFFIALLGSGQSFADGLVRESFEGVRATGMGNAYIAIVDDSSVLFTNPASLVHVSGVHYNLFDFTLGVDSLKTANALKNFVFNGDSGGLATQDLQYMRFNWKMQFITKYFGIGFFNNTQGYFDFATFSVLGYDIPKVDVYTFSDTGAIAGMGFPVGPYFSFGGSVRALYRVGVDAHVTPEDLLTSLGGLTTTDFMNAAYDYVKTLAGTGYGFGVNLGVHAKLPLGGKNLPQLMLAATAEDVGQTSFTALGAATAPPPIRPSYNAGGALVYGVGKTSKFTLSMEMRHILDDLPFVKQSHLGLEFRHRAVSLRTGLYQGYFTYGASFEALPHTKIHLSSYAVELGDSFQERSTRWYLAQIVVGFNPF